jgi:DNA-3-methyladenine glycosylase
VTALERAFFARPVLTVARDLVGCVLRHGDTAGVIVETEAYHQSEPASHSYTSAGREPTTRAAVLFGEPGTAYVYFSYGMHALVNAVCEPPGVGAAVLFRALQPLHGIEIMRARRGAVADLDLCSGPGKLTQALGIGLELNATDLIDGPIVVEAPATRLEVVASARIGITKAVELPWRFSAAGNRYVSRPRPPAQVSRRT